MLGRKAPSCSSASWGFSRIAKYVFKLHHHPIHAAGRREAASKQGGVSQSCWLAEEHGREGRWE